MFDLFRVPTDIPGYTEAGNKNGPTRADAIQVAVAAEHSDWRLVPYVQVYEFETLLFTDLGVLAREAADIVDAEAFDSLREATRDVPPEEINDGPSTAPSRRIEACTWGFRKTIHGIQTVAALGLDNLKVRCPRFGNWLSELESLGEITI